MLGKKTNRSEKNAKEIKLLTSEKIENFKCILNKLEKAEELYMEYEAEKSKKKRWEIIKNIIDLVEINPKYNYEFLKLNQLYEKNDYEENLKQLGPTLSNEDFLNLTKTEQKNPSLELFDLLNLLLKSEKEFDEKTKKIINNNYNIPLIEGNERIRINYYLRLFTHFEIFLNDEQKKYLLNKKNKISEENKNKLDILKDKYDNTKIGIQYLKDIIPIMKNFFKNINLEENKFNIKIFIFMLYITDIFVRIDKTGDQPEFIKYLFLKEIDPKKELAENKSLTNIINIKEYGVFPKNYGIKKKYNDEEIDEKDREKDRKMYEYEIYNQFESINFDGRNYIINNLSADFRKNAYIPLEVLLLRNQSLSYFEKNNKNFLNVNDNIYIEFKKYFINFIKSKCVQEALEKDERYKNIINIIKDDDIINKFLDDKYLKSIPLFEFSGTGYTNKDLLVFCVTGFPCMIYRYATPQNNEDYNLLKGIIILFNIAMKLITTLHEMIIYLCFGYLNYITEGKISHESPKKNSKISERDGGLFFEQILFGKKYTKITLYEVLVILNGDCFDSIEKLQENLRDEFNLDNFEIKSSFLKLIMKEFSINLKKIKKNKNVQSTMKSSGDGLCIRRNEIILPYKAPSPYKK